MKRSLIILTIFIVGVAFGIIGSRYFRSDHVCGIIVTNLSNKNITSVRVVNPKSGGIQIVDNIPPKGSKSLSYFVSGESSYRIIVLFNDNKSLSAERYVESGYTVNEMVHDNKIEPDFNVYKVY